MTGESAERAGGKLAVNLPLFSLPVLPSLSAIGAITRWHRNPRLNNESEANCDRCHRR